MHEKHTLDIASPLGGDVEEIRSHGSSFLASPLGGDVETQTFFDNMGGCDAK